MGNVNVSSFFRLCLAHLQSKNCRTHSWKGISINSIYQYLIFPFLNLKCLSSGVIFLMSLCIWCHVFSPEIISPVGGNLWLQTTDPCCVIWRRVDGVTLGTVLMPWNRYQQSKVSEKSHRSDKQSDDITHQHLKDCSILKVGAAEQEERWLLFFFFIYPTEGPERLSSLHLESHWSYSSLYKLLTVRKVLWSP